MKRRRKRRASPAPLICLLAVLACIVALRISVSEETAASAQMTGKLENPATTAPVRLLEVEKTEAEQVTWAEDRPARAARYVNIEMTDEELAELAAVVFLEAGNQSAEGQQAVVEVVFNRVLHSAFPDTVHDVLHQGENGDVPQFSTIYAVSTATPTQAQYDAINGALYGDTMHRAEDVAALTEDLVYTIRGALNALPGRLAVDVAAVSTPAEASEVIRKEVSKVMRELAGYHYDPKKYEERVRERRDWSERDSDDE